MDLFEERKMYVCENCGAMFREPVETHDDPSPAGVSLPSGYYTYWECPVCGSDWIEEAKECPACGEFHNEYGNLCKECAELIAEGLERLQASLGMKDEDFEEAIIDNYKW